MASRATSLWICVALALLGGGLSAGAGTALGVPPGVQPLPAGECNPDNGWGCLNQGRYAEAISSLEREVALGADPRALVALGIAYDGVGRFREASDRWRQARRVFSARGFRSQPADYDHLVGLEPPLFERQYAKALSILGKYLTPHDAPGAWSCCPLGHPQTAPYNLITFQDLDLVDPITNAVHIAADGDPRRGAELISGFYVKAPWSGELRYARAIMLLAIGRRDEARFELRIAARLNSVYPSDSGPYEFQWSALSILEHLRP